MVEEEYIILTIGQGGTNESQYIENMYGYTNERGNYFMVAAVVGSVREDGESEFSLVGAIGANCSNTAELKVMNYHQAMETVDHKEWQQTICVEHEKMQKYNAFKVVHKKDVPEETKLVDYAWAMKKKPSGVFWARLAARGFKQEEGRNYSNDDKSPSVITDISIAIVMVFCILANWSTQIIDVEGAFLHGSFQNKNKKIFYTGTTGITRVISAVGIVVITSNNLWNNSGSFIMVL